MDKLSVLQHQNQKLALQLEEKRRESRELEKRLASHEAKDQEYSHTLLCVRRLWDQLDSDVQSMCNGLVQNLGHLLVDANGPSKEDHKPAAAFIGKDPFLARLLAGADSAVVSTAVDAIQEMESDCSGVEKALQAKSISSKQLLSRLLDLMRALHARSAASNGSSGGTVSLQPDARMRQLEQALDTAAAQHRLLTEQHSQAMDRLVEAQARIRQLEDDAVDHQQAMSSAQRKLLAMQQSSSQQITTGEPHGDAAGHPLKSAHSSLLVNGEGLEDGGAEEVSALLAKRTAELDAEREAHLKTTRELTEAKARLGEESSWVANTRAYQALSAELAVAHEALASRQRDLEAMLHEKEVTEARLADRNLLAQRECQLAARLAEVTPRMQALLTAKTESDAACTEAETTLMCERQRLEGSRTAAELRTMVNVLQTQLQVKEQQMEQAQVPLSRINACTEEVMASKAAVAEAQAERELARRTVAELTATVQDAKKREDALHERVSDMQAFVDVLSSYCGQDAEAQELATAHAQLEALNVRCAALQSQLDTCHGRGTAAQAAERTAAERLSQAQSEVVSVRGQLAASKAQAEELTILLAAAKSECSLYTREIESTSAAYIEMQTQNQRLLGLLADKEEEAAAFAAEKLKLKREEARLEEAVGMGRAHVERLTKELADAAAMRETSDREMGRLATELAGAREQLRVALWRIASLEAECHRREEAVSSLTVQLDASQKAGASSRQELADEVERGTKERHKRQRLEDENKSLTVRLAKLRKAGAGGSAGGSREELTEEVEAMRKLLNCSVCHDRQKNVIITKCGHVFCDECVNRTIASRNRKCPGCGLVFSPTDIKPFFFT